MNGNHFTTINHSAATLTRESCHGIANSTFLWVVFLDSLLPLERSLAFLAKNKGLTLFILQLVILALPNIERVAVDL